MKYLINKLTNKLDSSQLGGKSYNLLFLKESGINVPDFLIIPPSIYHEWHKNGLLPQDFCLELKEKLKSKEESLFSIRSSMNLEDGEKDSFAGILETYLYIEKNAIEEHIIKCFQSLGNERVTTYLKEKNLNSKKLQMSVVVQDMIDPDASGVLFTRSPAIENTLVLIEAGYGVGEGIVAGHVEVDQYYVDRNKQIIQKKINKKESAITRAVEKNQTRTVKVLDHLQDKSCLSDLEILELTEIGLKIEKLYNHPVDIEWAIKEGRIFILQTRPITQKFGDIEVYIDTNLSESYPGLISNMGASFVNKMYELVHREIGFYLGYSEKRMNILKPFFESMVTSINGHMYYRLKSYYTLLLSIPGGEDNLKNWHRMIGGSAISFDISTDDFKPSFIEKTNYYKFLLKLIFRHNRVFNSFYKNGKKDLDNLKNLLAISHQSHNTEKMISKACTNAYGFGLTGLNDLLTMKFLNLLVKRLNKFEIDIDILNSLLKTSETVDSLLPLLKLEKLKKELAPNTVSEIEKNILSLKDCPEHLKLRIAIAKLENDEDQQRINEYLDEYGHRSYEELKLESISLEHNSSEFIALLKNKNEKLNRSLIKNESQTHKSDKEKIRDFLRSPLNRFITNKTRQFIKTREAGRLLRGQFYHLIRCAILKLSSQLNSELELSYNTQDFFHLDLKDIEQLISFDESGPLAKEKKKLFIQEKINKYKKLNNQYKQSTDYPEIYFKDITSTEDAYFSHISKENMICSNFSGLGASNGVISGEVIILNSPSDIQSLEQLKNLNSKILVTANTDPAWVHIMAQSMGLISERGSLLSHTAIIGRELGVPTIVGVKGICHALKNGDKISMNGKTGEINLIS